MHNEQDTKKLLSFRATIEQRIQELEQEIKDLEKAMQEIDKLLVSTGFKTFTTEDTIVLKIPQMDAPPPISKETEDQMNITSKDGTILGNMQVENRTIIFTPVETFEFTTFIPPFQSFLIERVFDNMRKTDLERSTNGELDPSEILNYKVNDQDGKIISLKINNYGGERRLREINSSLRWTLDKMYDKLTQG